MARVRVKFDRKFIPHPLLLTAARRHLERAKERKAGCFYEWLGAILMSALSIEAIGNTYGEVLIPDWKDFERASPIAKLRLVATACSIDPNLDEHPWATACQLSHCRNRIAHARPQHLKVEGAYTNTTYERAFYPMPESKSQLEKMITEGFAIKGHDAVEKILETFNSAIDLSKLIEVTMDGWFSDASTINDDVTSPGDAGSGRVEP
jgi:hypothetical protein